MKTILKTVVVAFALIVTSCGNITKQPATAEGLGAMEEEIKSNFGDDAYFTEITIANAKPIGNTISLIVTDAPESLTMGQWSYVQNGWKQTSEITLEIPEGSKASDFMFQLDDKINLSTLGGLVEKATEKLSEDKKIDGELSLAHIKIPSNGDTSKMNYLINLKPENGGTTFSFEYGLDGELKDMKY